MFSGSLVRMYKVVRQVFDVFFAVAERRQLHGNDIQAVIEIFAEAFFGNFLLQVPVGSSNNADVYMLGLVGTEGANFLVLQDAQ